MAFIVIIMIIMKRICDSNCITVFHCNLLQLGHLGDLSKELIPDYESNEDFLKKAHHIMMEVRDRPQCLYTMVEPPESVGVSYLYITYIHHTNVCLFFSNIHKHTYMQLNAYIYIHRYTCTYMYI